MAQNLHGKRREPGIQTLEGSPGMETYPWEKKMRNRGTWEDEIGVGGSLCSLLVLGGRRGTGQRQGTNSSFLLGLHHSCGTRRVSKTRNCAFYC